MDEVQNHFFRMISAGCPAPFIVCLLFIAASSALAEFVGDFRGDLHAVASAGSYLSFLGAPWRFHCVLIINTGEVIAAYLR